MKMLDKLLQIERDKLPIYIEYTTIDGEQWRGEWPEFLLRALPWEVVGPGLVVLEDNFDIAQKDIPDVLRQLDRLPEGDRGTAYSQLIASIRAHMKRGDEDG